MPRGSTCKAKGCTANKNDNPELSFHSFPRNKERFKLWCDLIKRPDLNHGKAITSRMSMRVCSLHFEDHMYMSPTNKSRLIWCAVPKPVEIKVLNTEEAASVDHLLPEPEASEKTEALSSCAEDIIIKEESDMDQDTNNDVPIPSCCPLEDSHVEIFADTKVGILEQSHLDQFVEERVESKSFQDDPDSFQASCSTKSNALECITQSSVCDSEGFHNLVLPSEDVFKTPLIQGKNVSSVKDVMNEIRIPLKGMESDQDNMCRSSELLNTGSLVGSQSHTNMSVGTMNQSPMDKHKSSCSRTSLPINNGLGQSFMLQDPHQHNASSETTNDICNVKKVSVSHNFTNTSLQSQLESMSPQSPICSPNSFPVTQLSTSSDCVAVSQESPSCQSKPSKSDSSGLIITDTISMNEDMYEKSKGDTEITYETGKNVCSEDCGCDKCFTAEEAEKKAGATKSITRRTYSGPIRRQVVRTKSGGKRTIMIVNKASLKNLQARGLIRPITKYMANHPHAVQSLKKNINQYGSVGADHSSKLSQSKDSFLSEGEESSKKNSSIHITQQTTDEHCIRESDTESWDEPYPSSHTSQTLQPHTPNQDSQAPVTVSWTPVNGSNALSFTFTVNLPTEANKLPGTSQDPLQIATSLLNNGAHCKVNLSNSQGRDTSEPNQMPNSQSSKNSTISPDLRRKEKKESVSAHSITSGISSQDPLRIKTSIVSSKHVLSSPVVSPLSKNTDMDSDCFSSRTTSSIRNASTATLTHKHSNIQPFHATIPGLPCEASTEEKKIHCSKGPEGNKEEDQLAKTKPKNRDSVQWIALPSLPVQQPQPSSSKAPEQIQQANLTKRCQMSNVTLHSPEKSSVAYGAFSTMPLDQRGKRLHIPPFYRSPNKELKLKYARLLNKHRHRYYLLLKKYKILEEKFSAVKDVGTPQQVIRDAQKFLSEEHILFLESQMFLRNRPGTGNRFSRKFMKLMIEYYKRSAAGYRFLRTIFTIPSVKTIQKWLSKEIEFRNLDEDAHGDSREDSETGNDEEAYPPRKIKPNNICQDSNSYEKFAHSKVSTQNLEYEDNSADDYDSEESDPEEMEAEEVEHKC